MVQNRNKLINHLTGNLATAVVHKVLEQAASDEYLKKYYEGELLNSIERARSYREKINPISEPLPEKDATEIREKVVGKAFVELKVRIAKGYKNVNLELAKEATEKMLVELNIASP